MYLSLDFYLHSCRQAWDLNLEFHTKVYTDHDKPMTFYAFCIDMFAVDCKQLLHKFLAICIMRFWDFAILMRNKLRRGCIVYRFKLTFGVKFLSVRMIDMQGFTVCEQDYSRCVCN